MTASPPDPRHGRRKAPRQERSRATIDCIKQAAREILIAEGFAATTTSRIAERAGVSIGSLYQYFSTREAVLLALYEDLSIELAGAMKDLLLTLLEMPIEESVRTTADRILAWHAEHRAILLDLPEQAAELHLETHPLSYNNLVRGAIKAFVTQRTSYRAPADIERVAFFLERIVVDSIRAYLRRPPPGLSRARLLDDIAQIVAEYLRPAINS